MLTTTFFDHPIATLISRLSSSPDIVPSVATVLASMQALREDLNAFNLVLDKESAELDEIIDPMLRTYFAAVVLASQVARLPAGAPGSDEERAAAFGDHAEAIMRSLGARVGPSARAMAARVLGLSAAASAAAAVGMPGARVGPPSVLAEA